MGSLRKVKVIPQGVRCSLLPFLMNWSLERINLFWTRRLLCSIPCFLVKLCGIVVMSVWNRLRPPFVRLFTPCYVVFDDDSSPSSFTIVCALSYSDLPYLSQLMQMWPKYPFFSHLIQKYRRLSPVSPLDDTSRHASADHVDASSRTRSNRHCSPGKRFLHGVATLSHELPSRPRHFRDSHHALFGRGSRPFSPFPPFLPPVAADAANAHFSRRHHSPALFPPFNRTRG